MVRTLLADPDHPSGGAVAVADLQGSGKHSSTGGEEGAGGSSKREQQLEADINMLVSAAGMQPSS